ncbi:hypothetical protein E2986_07142 [Frieseomelitta varia]|uniref:MYND-type domain-containing protein n=1 Tax=Frieseomelitta varia TaxID=561572 RepID=A0A833VMC7_9HYME|nr:hypothetical protein E2986_07142 [Frieseomelitta varia]
MKELGNCKSNDSRKKPRGKSKKQKPTFKLFTKASWPKVMISRDSIIYKKIKDSSGDPSLSFLHESSSKLHDKEEKDGCRVQHLYCEGNAASFEEEQNVCLISSSDEVRESRKSYEERLRGNEEEVSKKKKKIDEDNFECTPGVEEEESVISATRDQQKPIFVDLTADEKNTWKQTILKRFCDVKTDTVNEAEGENRATNIVLEPRIVIADNPSKLSCNGNGSLATALRDRGPCLIPVQPNRSLPILPAPSIPTRFFRKDSSAVLVQPARTTADVESMKSIGALPNEELIEKDVDPEARMSSTKDAMNYVVPQISNVESLSAIKRRGNNDAEQSEKNNAKENRKKKKSQQEANGSQSKGKCAEGSIKEFLTNFCGSNATEGIQNLCTEKCVRAASTTKEDERSGNKLVPPLKLKKVLHTETEGYNDSQIVTRVEHESNYRIITDGTSQSPFSLSAGNWDDILYEKDADFTALNTDSFKLKYRRNRLKQKLRELRGKAMDLAKEMASDLNSQESTRLRQVMNRYEKQIENLSKLHNKLSAALSISKEAIDVNNDSTNPSDNNYPRVSLNKRKTDFQTNDSSPVSSPEPPKLSPRSSLDIILPEEVRNSPPILPLCLTISSSQDSVEEELQAAERKVWPVNEELMKPTFPTDPLAGNLTDSVNKGPPDIEKHARATPVLHVDVESSDFGANKRDFNYSNKIAQLPENNVRAAREKSNEKSKPIDEFPRSQRQFMIQEPDKIKRPGFADAESVISSATDGVEVSTTIQKNETFESIPGKQLPPLREQTVQSNFYRSNQEEMSFAKAAHENSMNAQKVSSSSGQSNQFNPLRTMLNQEQFTLRQNYKGEEISSDSVQRNSGNHSITEQFPTLGNWLARMSKKQSSMAKPKLHVAENVPLVPTENVTRQIPGTEKPKIIGSNINHIMNATPQRGTEKWQYHHQQQQLQHVASSVTLSQPVAAVPPLRPGICPPLPMTQFYPNNYAIDPYNGAALNYHPAIYPYGPYPYHPRLHTGSLPLHFPTQESLRSMQHTDKRFPLLQDPIVRYPSPSTSTLQHPSNLEFDRLRGNTTNNNIAGATTCLPSLFLSPPSLSTSHQALPQPSHVPGATKSIINRNVTNQTQDNNFNEESHENTKYQQMQNFLFDRLALVKTTDNFVPTNSVIGNDGRSMTSIVSAAQYRMPVISSYAQLSKNVPVTEIRNCETPHLGKVNRSPNSLHNFTCSNCGIIGPKFKCLGCEMAFYCDERCQEKHWDIHVQRCPKKMPKLKKVI